MPEPNALAVLRAALPRVLEALPRAPRIRVLRALPDLAGDLPRDADITMVQRFKPLHDALQAEGGARLFNESDADVGADIDAPPPQLVVVLPPRSRGEGRALLARAMRDVAEGGVVLAAALNDEGAKSFEKDLAALSPLAGVISKAHGRAFWTAPRPADLPDESAALAARGLAADAPARDAATGLWTQPGVFNEGRLDAGSALLIEHLPITVKGHIADLGAGSGLLSLAAIERCPGVASLDLFEAEARALDLARRNLEAARVPLAFHWHDVGAGLPNDVRGRFDAVLCNPPFHVGSRGVPALGRAFIAAAAFALKREGELLLVANRHLPYEDALREAFAHGEALAEQGGFKVYRAWSPRAQVMRHA